MINLEEPIDEKNLKEHDSFSGDLIDYRRHFLRGMGSGQKHKG